MRLTKKDVKKAAVVAAFAALVPLVDGCDAYYNLPPSLDERLAVDGDRDSVEVDVAEEGDGVVDVEGADVEVDVAEGGDGVVDVEGADVEVDVAEGGDGVVDVEGDVEGADVEGVAEGGDEVVDVEGADVEGVAECGHEVVKVALLDVDGQKVVVEDGGTLSINGQSYYVDVDDYDIRIGDRTVLNCEDFDGVEVCLRDTGEDVSNMLGIVEVEVTGSTYEVVEGGTLEVDDYTLSVKWALSLNTMGDVAMVSASSSTENVSEALVRAGDTIAGMEVKAVKPDSVDVCE